VAEINRNAVSAQILGKRGCLRTDKLACVKRLEDIDHRRIAKSDKRNYF